MLILAFTAWLEPWALAPGIRRNVRELGTKGLNRLIIATIIIGSIISGIVATILIKLS